MIEIGALTTHHDLETTRPLAEGAGLLAEIAHVVGDQQVRNRGTLGGTLAHADPAADYPAGVLALDAVIVARGPNGERTIPIDEFFLGFLTTALEPDELLTGDPASGTGKQTRVTATRSWPIRRLAMRSSVWLRSSRWMRPGAISAARIGITGAGDVAYRPHPWSRHSSAALPTKRR